MFKRKPRNRRKRREEHVLEVKVHSDYQRQLRIQYATVTLTVLLVLGLVTFGVYRLGKFATRKFFHENPRFAIATIDVQTDGHLTREQIVGLANIRTGQSIF